MLFLEGDVLDCLKSLPDQSVHCVVTSPPYMGLRNYGLPPTRWPSMDYHPIYGFTQHLDEETVCLGLEKTPESYICHLVLVFRELWRVLRDDGTVFLNLGDSFASGKGSCFNPGGGEHSLGQDRKIAGVHPLDRGNKSTLTECGLKPKDLMMIPSRVALALQADGWYLRSDIIWSKPNPMPESVTDRPTRSHEYIFLLAKSERYFYDSEAIKEPCATESIRRISEETFDSQTGGDKDYSNGTNPNRSMRKTLENFARKQDALGKRTYTGFNDRYEPLLKRNRRDTWVIPTQAFPGSHFAVFPEALVEPCIKAGTSEKGCCPKCGSPWVRVMEKSLVNTEGWGVATKDHTGATQGSNAVIRNAQGRAGDSVSTTLGWQPTCSCNLPPVPCTVLDPFGGSGTVAKVSRDLGRESIYIDLNPEYVQMAMERVGSSLFNSVEHRKIGAIS